jgi:hypothetical protein
MGQDCQPCKDRGRWHVPGTREVNAEWFCLDCFRGRNGPEPSGSLAMRSGLSDLQKAIISVAKVKRMAAIAMDYNEGLRILDICLKHRCSSAMAIQAAKNAQLALRQMDRSAIDKRKLIRDYLAGRPYRELSQQYGIPASSILFHLRKAGIEPNRNKHA